jgi:hypothetical protein
MPIPPVPAEALRDAMERFDREFRRTPEWADWEHNRAHLYAIESSISNTLAANRSRCWRTARLSAGYSSRWSDRCDRPAEHAQHRGAPDLVPRW